MTHTKSRSGRPIGTIADATRILPMGYSTIKRHAPELGGFKLPGCRPWCFYLDELEALGKKLRAS